MLNLVIESIKKRGIFRTSIFIFITIIYYLFRILFNIVLKYSKINNSYVVFYTKPDYSDNGKILYEYMTQNKNKYNYNYFWIVESSKDFRNKKNTLFLKNKSKFHSGLPLRTLYYLSKSKYILYTHISPFNNMKKKKGQYIVNLWHGCGYKNEVKSNKKYIDKNYFDIVLVPGDIFIKTKSKFFGCDEKKILPIGYPRYDILLKDNKSTEEFVKKIKKNNKLILWLPTFRKSVDGYFSDMMENIYDIPLLSCDNELININEFCKENNILLIIKRHPFQIKYQAEQLAFSNINFIDDNFLKSNKIELYSLLRYSDALVTDYSSVAIDYILLDKPIGFLLGDFENYAKTRGFVFENPLEYMPGYHIYNLDDFKNMISDVSKNNDKYIKNRHDIKNKMHNSSDNYCEKIIKKIF